MRSERSQGECRSYRAPQTEEGHAYSGECAEIGRSGVDGCRDTHEEALAIIQARDETMEAWTRLAVVEVVKKSQIPNMKAELAGFADILNMGCKRSEVKDNTKVLSQRNWGREFSWCWGGKARISVCTC